MIYNMRCLSEITQTKRAALTYRAQDTHVLYLSFPITRSYCSSCLASRPSFESDLLINVAMDVLHAQSIRQRVNKLTNVQQLHKYTTYRQLKLPTFMQEESRSYVKIKSSDIIQC